MDVIALDGTPTEFKTITERFTRDLYRQIAARRYGIPAEQVTDDQRQAVKRDTFMALYGNREAQQRFRERVVTGRIVDG